MIYSQRAQPEVNESHIPSLSKNIPYLFYIRNDLSILLKTGSLYNAIQGI